MNNINLVPDKRFCCGCGTCMVACPQNAISMKQDILGFIFPEIDQNKCIKCGICVRTCAFGKIEQNQHIHCFAGINKNNEQRKISTSAGIFSAVATAFIEQGGVVCGASMNIQNGIADVRHVLIGSIIDLPKLQGSKYVQSDASYCYAAMKNAFSQGRRVLFSGTPCQVAGVKSLFKKYSGQLFTMDIICHGVPNVRFFNDYIKNVALEKKAQIIGFKFRNKKYGWGLNGTIELKNSTNKKEMCVRPENSSYYELFLNGETYRDSCYHCPYACQRRIGDLTIGDYWGVQEYSPEFMAENGGPFKGEEGVSCILENASKGTELLKIAVENLIKMEIDIDKVLIINSQLKAPSKHSEKRAIIFNAYQKFGYASVERIWRSWKRKSTIKARVKRIVPSGLKKIIKKYIKH